LAAKVRRIHILNASIRSHAEDDGIKYREAAHPSRGLAKKRPVEIHFGIFARECAGYSELMAMPKRAYRHHRQSNHEYARKNENENEADVWIDRPAGGEVEYPETNNGKCRADGQNGPDHRKGIIGKMGGGPEPSQKALTKCHGIRKSISFRWTVSIDAGHFETISDSSVPALHPPGFEPLRESTCTTSKDDPTKRGHRASYPPLLNQ
jgi:hypothetical protein